MRRIRWLVIICVVLLLVYAASPYVAFWRFTVALRSSDTAAIAARVDFPAVRESLKKQLIARFSHAGTGHKRWNRLGPTLIDALVDAYATSDGLAMLIANPSALRDLQLPQQSPSVKGFNWSKL